MNDEGGMTARLKDILAWFHKLYLDRLSYFIAPKKKFYKFFGVY